MSDINYRAVLPDGWPQPRGFSHAVVATGSRTVRVAGQLSTENGAPVASGLSTGEQWRLALANVITVVRAAGGDVSHVVLLRAYVTDIEEFKRELPAIGQAWASTFGQHFPAMTLVGISQLVDPNARVEIEGEAVLP